MDRSATRTRVVDWAAGWTPPKQGDYEVNEYEPCDSRRAGTIDAGDGAVGVYEWSISSDIRMLTELEDA